MYQSPDFVKVDVNVADSFAAYSNCHYRSETLFSDQGDHCQSTYQQSQNFFELGWGNKCLTGDMSL